MTKSKNPKIKKYCLKNIFSICSSFSRHHFLFIVVNSVFSSFFVFVKFSIPTFSDLMIDDNENKGRCIFLVQNIAFLVYVTRTFSSVSRRRLVQSHYPCKKELKMKEERVFVFFGVWSQKSRLQFFFQLVLFIFNLFPSLASAPPEKKGYFWVGIFLYIFFCH